MPTTVRIVVASTDALTNLRGDVDSVINTENSRIERWLVSGGATPERRFWPSDGEMNLFLQLWQPQPAPADTTFRIFFPSAPQEKGWECIVPKVGVVPLLLRKPAAIDILDLSADQYTVEVAAVYF